MIKIGYLEKYTKDIERLTNNILSMRELYGDENVVIDIEEAQKLVEVLEALQFVIETTNLD